MSRNLPIRVTISLVFRYIVWQFITLIINYKEIALDTHLSMKLYGVGFLFLPWLPLVIEK